VTHKELVEIGKRWLWRKCDIVVTELTTGISETPDIIGWKSWKSTLIECKTSRQDFLKDKHKWSRRKPEYGIGNYRYFLILENIIQLNELPEKWGLLEVDKNGKICCVKKPERFEPRLEWERIFLVSCIKRIGQNPPKDMTVRAYKYQTKQRASMGVKEGLK